MRYRLNIAKNESIDVRIGTVVIKQNESEKIVNVTVNQLGTAIYEFRVNGDRNNVSQIAANDTSIFTANPSIINASNIFSREIINIASSKNGEDIEYEVTSHSDWITINSIGIQDQLNITIASNTTGSARTGTIVLTQQGGDNKTLTITINQSAE